MIEEINPKDIKIPLSGVRQAVIEKSSGDIYCIQKIDKKETLYVFDKNINQMAKFNPPDGFSFYYISRNYETIGVVCTQNEKVYERDDWLFSHDKSKNTLTRISPAY